MVISKCEGSDYRFMVYTGKVKTTPDTMWLDVANQFVTSDAFNSFGVLDTVKRNEEGTLSLYYHSEDCDTNLIEVSYDAMEKLTCGEIVEVHMW